MGPLLVRDSPTNEIATKVYSAGLEPKVMTFSHKATYPPK